MRLNAAPDYRFVPLHTHQKNKTNFEERILGPEYVFPVLVEMARRCRIIAMKALNLANEIFGFNGWYPSWIPSRLSLIQAQTEGFYLEFSVVVRLTSKTAHFTRFLLVSLIMQ